MKTMTEFLFLVKSAMLSKSITSEPGIFLTKSSLEIITTCMMLGTWSSGHVFLCLQDIFL